MSHNRSSCHQIDTAIEDALRVRIVGVVVLSRKNGKLVYQRAAGDSLTVRRGSRSNLTRSSVWLHLAKPSYPQVRWLL